MRQAEKNRLLRKSRLELVAIIDETQKTVRRWKEGVDDETLALRKADRLIKEAVQDPPFYWMIGYMGWGSAEDDVDFLDGGDINPTAQMAVDAWEEMRQESMTRASDPEYNSVTPQLLIYRIDEVGKATTDRRWVFKPKS